MFNFIFEGKIGDILAPVVPSSKFFLAIQHHKNDEVQHLMNSTDLNHAESGCYAIHIACRYNNRFALEAILSRGVSVDTADQSGNTPLHYACKYGHIDICRFLIEKGASAAKKNSKGETPYDVAADHHVVRQYMLPIQFQAERSAGDGGGYDQSAHMGISTASSYGAGQPYGQSYASALHGSAGTNYQSAPAPAPPAQSYGAPQPSYYGAPAAPSLALPTGEASPAQPLNPSPPPVATPASAATGSSYAPSQRSTPTTTRVIQPDGFHSSASDPALQKKYGHIQIANNIAPPPTSFPIPGPGANPYTAPAGPAGIAGPPPIGGNPYAGGSGVYSRYVAYDAHTGAPAAGYGAPAPLPPAPAPAAHSTFPSFPSMSRPSAFLPTHAPAAPGVQAMPPTAAAPPTPPAHAAATGVAPVPLLGLQPPRAPGITGAAPVTTPPGSTEGTTTAPSSQRLLGNKTVPTGDSLLSGLASPSKEDEVNVISSTSSAVL